MRPLFGWLGLIGTGLDPADRAAIAFFGIRGMGSLYYAAYAAEQAELPGMDSVWALVIFVVVVSVVVHGVASTPVLARIDRAGSASAGRVEAVGDLVGLALRDAQVGGDGRRGVPGAVAGVEAGLDRGLDVGVRRPGRAAAPPATHEDDLAPRGRRFGPGHGLVRGCPATPPRGAW